MVRAFTLSLPLRCARRRAVAGAASAQDRCSSVGAEEGRRHGRAPAEWRSRNRGHGDRHDSAKLGGRTKFIGVVGEVWAKLIRRVGGRRPLRPSSGRPEPGPKRYDRSGTSGGLHWSRRGRRGAACAHACAFARAGALRLREDTVDGGAERGRAATGEGARVDRDTARPSRSGRPGSISPASVA